MNTITSTARRTVLSTLTTLVLAAAFPQAGFAHSALDLGTWKLNAAKSSINPAPKSNTVTVEWSPQTGSPATGKAMIIANGKVYVTDDAGRKVLIGKKARSVGACGFRCQAGLAEKRRTVSYIAVNTKQPQPANVVAYDQR